MPESTALSHSDPISPRRLWFGAAAAAVAWAFQGAACSLISSKACQNGVGSLGPLSPAGVRGLLGAITLGLLAVSVAAGVVSFRNWRQLTDTRDLVHAEGPRRDQFMALTGIFVSVTFALGIIWAGLPLILLDVCVKAR